MEEEPVHQQRRRVYRHTVPKTPPQRYPPRPIFALKYHEERSMAFEIVLRASLFCLFCITENLPPFQRDIQPEEMWLYRYPIPEETYFHQVGGSYLEFLLGPITMIFYCVLVILIKWVLHANNVEARQAAYAFFLALPFTGTVVNILKNIAGRPRPDFLARCYGKNYYLWYSDMSRACFQDDLYVQDGRKSFPSGHSALAACCFGFLAIYLAGQLGSFQEWTKHKINSVILTIPTLLLPVIIAISRTCDNKHHWQDVSVGLLIGFAITYMSYRVYFPSLTDKNSHLPYVCIPYRIENVFSNLPRSWPVYSSGEEEEDHDVSTDDNNDNEPREHVYREPGGSRCPIRRVN